LIIYGTQQEFQNIRTILKELDIVPRQVLLDVLVAEVSLKDSESFGIDYEIMRKFNPTIFGQTFDSQGAVRSLGSLFPAGQFGSGITGVIGRGNAVRALINALATDSRVKILSSPSVLATDNRPARIQVGSEEPIPTGQIVAAVGAVNPSSSTTIQYRNTGRIVTIIPQVNSQGLVNLQILAEVSQRGANVAVGSDTFPAFDTRQAETTAVVQDGDTLAIGGIIADNRSRSRSGIPYLMDVPVIGRFFGTTSETLDRTELVMLITPHVIRSRGEGQIVTEEFKSRLSTVRNELERLRRDRERD
jgi:general secretion pathway protein D